MGLSEKGRKRQAERAREREREKKERILTHFGEIIGSIKCQVFIWN